MDAERFARVRALYDAVVDLAPSLRADALAAQGTPADLATEVLALCLASDNDRTGALDRARDVLLSEATAPAPAIGDVLGAWRVIADIGHGGMGRVYRVERSDGHYTQTAALKFIKGLAGEGAVALFSRERQLLAHLSHPRIARLIDGGTAAQGQPYLVMDYVDGVPIDRWCAQHRLRRESLLDLFVAACSAVSHAHRQLVVHCDLKPSNILVTRDGEPVLLDFGIARMADRMAEQAGTEPPGGGPAGYTPRYASPEQRRGEQVGTASDVYSLGVVLAEMMASAGLSTDGELAAVIAMATREQPDQRYASVDALCEDLARLRHHRPLQALPATPRYRLAKFLRRRWLATSVTAAMLLVCSVFIVTVIGERQRALAAEQRAIAERDRAQQAESAARASEATARQTVDFLISVFDGANPDAGSGTVSIASLLDEALLRADRDLAGEPATQAQMLAALARALHVIGQPARARELYARAIAIERQQQRPLVLAEMLIGNAARMLRDLPGQVPNDEVREALRLIDAHAREDTLLQLELRHAAASILGNDHPDEATPQFERALQLARELAPGSLRLSEVLGSFGWHERRAGRYGHAIALMEEAVALRLRLLGDGHDEYLAQLETLANTLALTRRFDDAEQIFRQAIALRRRDQRLDSAQGAWSLAQYATMLSSAGRAREALPLYDEIFAIAARKFAPDDGNHLVWSHNLADTLANAGDLDGARDIIVPTVDRVREAWGPNNRGTARMLLTRARILGAGGCDPLAGESSAEALAILQPQSAEDDADLLEARLERAHWLLACQRLDEAQAQLEAVASHRGSLHPLLALRLQQGEAWLRLQRDGGAAALQAVRDGEALAASFYAPADPRIALAMLPRARWLAAQGRHAEAAALAADILRGVEARLVEHSPWLQALRALRERQQGSTEHPVPSSG